MNDVDVPQELARLLHPLRGTIPLILATTLDALPLGRHIADALGGQLDAFLVAPVRDFGWVDELGHAHPADDSRAADAPACGDIGRELVLRRARLTPGRKILSATDRVVVVVDDRPWERDRLQACVDAVRWQVPELVVVAAVHARDSGPPLLVHVDFIACVPTRRQRPRPALDDARVRDLLSGG